MMVDFPRRAVGDARPYGILLNLPLSIPNPQLTYSSTWPMTTVIFWACCSSLRP